MRDANLENTILTNADLTDADFRYATLTNANLSNAILTDANINGATLTNTDFTNSIIIGANFSNTTSKGFTKEQLYSTASYQSQDLHGIILPDYDMTAWNFANQDLTDAFFSSATLTDADFTNANLTDARFEAATLAGADMSNANLTNAYLYYASLINTNLNNANLTETHSYIYGGGFPMSFNFNSNLDNTDLRGRSGMDLTQTIFKQNMIYPGGYVEGMTITNGQTMRIWDYDGYYYDEDDEDLYFDIPIYIQDEFTIDPDSTLRMVFEDDNWGSKILFEPAIPVSLSGTLELCIDSTVDPASLLGTTFDLFDFDNVTLTSTFDSVTTQMSVIQSGYVWNTSHLHTTGEIALVSILPGDYNGDLTVDQADYTTWADSYGQTGAYPLADGNGDGIVDQADYTIWADNYGSTLSTPPSNPVPEPATLALISLTSLAILNRRS